MSDPNELQPTGMTQVIPGTFVEEEVMGQGPEGMTRIGATYTEPTPQEVDAAFRQGLEDLVNQYADDPENELAKLKNSQVFAEQLNMSLEEAYNMHEQLAEAWTGEKGIQPKNLWQALQMGVDTGYLSEKRNELAFLQLFGDARPQTAAEIAALTDELAKVTPEKMKWWRPKQLAYGTGSVSVNMLQGMKEGTIAGLLTGGLSALAGASGGSAIAPGPGTAIGGGLSFLGGFGVGMMWGSGAHSFRQMAGQKWMELTDMEEQTGEKMNPALKRLAAIVSGALSAAIEVPQIFQLLKTIPGVKQALNQGIGGVVQDYVTKGTFKQIAAKTLKEYALDYVTPEVMEEVLQEMVSVVTDHIVVTIEQASGKSFEHTSLKEDISRYVDTFLNSVGPLALLGLPGTSLQLVQELPKTDKTIKLLRDNVQNLSKAEAVAIAEADRRIIGRVEPEENRAATVRQHTPGQEIGEPQKAVVTNRGQVFISDDALSHDEISRGAKLKLGEVSSAGYVMQDGTYKPFTVPGVRFTHDRVTQQALRTQLQEAFPQYKQTPDVYDGMVTVASLYAQARGISVDQWIGDYIANVQRGIPEGGAELYQLGPQHIEYAKEGGFLNTQDESILEAVQTLGALDTEIYTRMRGMGAFAEAGTKHAAGHRFPNYREVSAVIQANPHILEAIRNIEKQHGVQILDDAGNLIPSSIEARTKIYGPKTQIPGEKYLAFPQFNRALAQDFLDRANIDHVRQSMVKAMEDAHDKNRSGQLAGKFKNLFDKNVYGVKSAYRTAPAIKGAEKTLAAVNLSSQCPMFHIGSNGCYLDGCYVTGMAQGTMAVPMYQRAFYAGEILQLSQEEVDRLNKVGGLRVNGQGDLSQFVKDQFADILRHSNMVGLKAKVITKQMDTFDMLAEFQQSKDQNLRDGASNTIVQASVDPYWVHSGEDLNRGSGAEPYVLAIQKAEDEGDAERVSLLQKELIKYYKDMGRDAKIINGAVYRKYGFSSKQIEEIGKKYPHVKTIVRAVISTPQEIAQFADKLPWVLQTWMHAKLPEGRVYSDVKGGTLDAGEIGNYQVRIAIEKQDGEWRVLAQTRKGDMASLEDARAYKAVEDYIKKNYSAADADRIFSTLAGQLELTPSALCCTAGASLDACMDCSSVCQSGRFLEGEGLEQTGRIAARERLFQGEEEGTPRAGIDFLADGRALIYAHEKSADFSSWVHEMAHIFRKQLADEDLVTIGEWAGQGDVFGTWSKEAEEKFAQGFEKYLSEGIAPTSELQRIFDKFKEWLRDVYARLNHLEMSQEVRDVYERLFATPEEIEAARKAKTAPITEKMEKVRQQIARHAQTEAEKQKILAGKTKIGTTLQSFLAGKKSGRAELQAQIKNQKAEKGMRDYIRKLAAYAMKPAGKSVDAEYRGAIGALQAQIDPHFRRAATIEQRAQRRANLEAFLDKNPDAARQIPKKLVDQLYGRPLNDWTVEELENFAAQIDKLKQEGRLKRSIRVRMHKVFLSKTKREMLNNIRKGVQPAAPGPIVGEPDEGVKKITRAARAATLRPSRIFDMLDGGRGTFREAVHNFFYDKTTDLEQTKLKEIRRRRELMRDIMEQREITVEDLAETRKIDGVEYTLDQIMDIYVGQKNELKLEALERGNRLSQDHMKRVIETMSVNEKLFADAILQDYMDNYERLRKAHLLYMNEDLGYEEAYSPIRRLTREYQPMEQEIAHEILTRQNLRKGYVWRGMTKHRLVIPAEYQKPIKLGLYEQWLSEVPRAEQYIHFAEHVKDMQTIANDRDFVEAVKQQYGYAYVKAIQKYTNLIANPNIYKSFTPLEQASRFLRKNVAIAYLAFNLVTMSKQLPSMLLYLPHAGSRLFSAAAQFIANPRSVIDFVHSRDEEMKQRSIERELEELKVAQSGTWGKIQAKIGKAGMWGIYMLDKVAVSIGWKAVYDRAIDQGMSEEEAIREAHNVTLRTQPAAATKDLAQLYTTNEFLNWATMFSNQLSQLYNITTYDIPKAFGRGDAGQGMLSIIGVTMSGLAIWTLAHRRLPKNKKDWIQFIATMLANMIPLFGKSIVSKIEGFQPSENPIIGVGGAGYDLITKGKFDDFVEAIAIAFGLPYIAGKRVVKAIKKGKLSPLIGGN